MTARDAILARIRTALADGAAPSAQGAAHVPAHRTVWAASREEKLARLTTRLRDYGVTVLRVAAQQDVAETARLQLARRNIASLIAPPDLPATWRPAAPVITDDAGQDAQTLDRIAGVITGCALAIAETGSIVLDGGAHQGRRAITLVPDYFLCVVRASQVVGIMPEAIAALRDAVADRRPITFVSGPSATADIELDRVVGVHGPRTLDVILVADE